MTPDADASYTPPSWAGKPKQPLYVDVIRAGSILEQHLLEGKDHFFIGSSSKADIIYPNPLVSSFHAVIQFKEDGSAYLCDLNSTNGTWHGATRLVPNEFVGLSNGSRMTFGHMNPKRILIIREASESDYPDAVTRKFSTRRVQNIVFTSEGRLSDVARRTLEASCATSKARTAAQQDPASSQWTIERAEDSSFSTSNLSDQLRHYVDESTGFLRIRDVLNSQLYHSLSQLQQDLCQQITATLRRFDAVRKKTDEEEDDAKAADLQRQMEERKADVHLLQQRLFYSTEEAFSPDDDDKEQAADVVRLSNFGLLHISVPILQTKEALDERLFDEDDIFYDRSDDWDRRAGMSTSPPLQATASKQAPQQSEGPLEKCDSTQLKEAEDDDALDRFMRENAAQLKADEQRGEALLCISNQQDLVSTTECVSPKRMTSKCIVQREEYCANPRQPSATECLESCRPIKKNRAMLHASRVLTQITQSRQRKQTFDYDFSQEQPDSPFDENYTFVCRK